MNQDGNYRDTRVATACAGVTDGGCACLSGAFSLCWNLDARLASIQESAEEIAATAKTSEIRTAAQKLVYMVSQELPDYRRRGLRDAALILALDIGRTAERIHVKQFEPEVGRGGGTRKGCKKEGKAPLENGVTRAQQIRDAVQSRLARRPRESVANAGQWVAEQHLDNSGKPEAGWSIGNVRRAIRGMKKPKSK